MPTTHQLENLMIIDILGDTGIDGRKILKEIFKN
jgi:hypothetical protein